MTAIITKPDLEQKLSLLSRDAQYDLACACNVSGEQNRKAGSDGKWIYPATLPEGGKSVLFKTLLTNSCTNDCKYCPLRKARDEQRFSLSPERISRVFMDYLRRGKVHGLFLSSGVHRGPEYAMQQLIDTAEILRRKHRFSGYIHLKIIPGASAESIEKAVSLASAVSLNIETAGEENFRRLSDKKDYMRDIVRPIKLIKQLTSADGRYSRVKQTTQFIVGASEEKDSELLAYMQRLYDNMNMQRIYFSAYQKGLGSPDLPGENSSRTANQLRLREHRLYQADYLFRIYGFKASEMPLLKDGSMPADKDPKLAWAGQHPERFPVDVNSAGKAELLRIPGIGPAAAKRIIQRRKKESLRSLSDISSRPAVQSRACHYISFSGKRASLF
ncbi:putative DNA modification/repair radical SAM protein [Sedimentisphaera cyanobacteriorum]|uniref:Putative DNA modification/repair radical SAM protein n=1 Tax=Sedimentisphaera cyanobacteriorum TaxID=1940790 RepID=A0A1Q2HP66_9BACT|nr:radical SAM protein [Sedimentisphaera cyanobacteriorum]AQQ09121.1 putative DNA modification/repair radical SAM protein [Sedimentisphaera cyanobacteriorum]